MKQNELKILKEMLKNPKASDRAIAKNAGVSQPTVTRMRQKFQKQGIIESYQLIPNLAKLEFEIMAVTITNNAYLESENIIFAFDTPKAFVILSVHRSFSDYCRFIEKNEIQVKQSFLTPTSKLPTRPLSFENLPL